MSLQQQPGNLNRLRANILIPSNSLLNITSSYLGVNGIKITPMSPTAEILRTMTGGVISEEPYQIYSITAAIVKSLGLGSEYVAQIQQTSSIGDLVVTADTQYFPLYTFHNCAIINTGEIVMNGTQADFNIEFQGILYINNDLWS